MIFCKRKWKFVSLGVVLLVFLLVQLRSSESDRCSTLYSANSLQICASTTTKCDFSQLIRSYFAYRSCVLRHPGEKASFVVFEAVNGLGNRLFGLISVTTYALITGRVLLVDWRPGDNHDASFDELFDDFPPHLPSRFSWSRSIHLLRARWINEIQRSSIPRDWSLYFDRELLCQTSNDFYRWDEHFGLQLLRWFSSRTEWIRTDQYFVPLLSRNRRTRPLLSKLVPDGQIFFQLATKILRPVDQVQRIVDEFQQKFLSDDEFPTIGVHMRTWFSADRIEPFENCFNLLMKTFFALTSTKIGLFVISNSDERREKLEKRLEGKYSNVVPLAGPKEKSMQNTLAELLILSRMKHLIISSKSTFGMVAQGLAGRGAWIVWQGASNEDERRRNALCQFESSSEPEYQMIGQLHPNDSCIHEEKALTKFIGERTVL